ncbi:unnamed protein product [Adineta ricciae]|uniref:Uncharacterized protein n=1 Tax=Adineta ricciae TaxID=249248 RepID=A0A815LPY5_ADIRI|nr:unnamed protein product [Adineta ricciae]CAF1472824.1 unnamed protein product [Adineta ricciae]
MCCLTLQKRSLNELFYVPRPSFLIPIFRAPTTTSTTTLATTIKSSFVTTDIAAKRIFSTFFYKQEQKQSDLTSTVSTNMISQRIFENLVLTNTIVAAFCIVLMVTITGFLIFLLVPAIRRRWLNEKSENERKLEELPTLSRQPSFHHFTLGPSRYNPIFEPTAGTTTTTTQFGLFQPHTTTATLLHPTIWAPISPTSVIPTPIPTQQPQIASTPPASLRTRSMPPGSAATTTTAGAGATSASNSSASAAARPPLPAHPPTQVQRSPRKR